MKRWLKIPPPFFEPIAFGGYQLKCDCTVILPVTLMNNQVSMVNFFTGPDEKAKLPVILQLCTRSQDGVLRLPAITCSPSLKLTLLEKPHL